MTSGTSGVYVAVQNALPVDLLNFNVKSLNNGIAKLEWATVSEVNNDFFEIEKSIDNVNFVKIGLIEGVGNSQQLSNYTFVDNQFNNVTSYYRLKQVDYNGAFEYSPTVVLNNFADESISNFNIFPNPAINQVSIEDLRLRNNSVKISVTDIHGKISYSETFNDFTNIDLSHLTKGMYFISFLNENNQLIGNQKLLINK